MNFGKIFSSISHIVAPAKKTQLKIVQDLAKDISERADKITLVSDSLASVGRAQIVMQKKTLLPDVSYIKQLTHQLSRTDDQISQTTNDVCAYLRKISDDLENAALSATGEEVEDILARKAVIDYLTQNIRYSKVWSQGVGFRFGLPTKEIPPTLDGFWEEFNKSVSLFKKNEIFDISDYDLKQRQFDAEDIIKKYADKKSKEKFHEYNKLFNPIERLGAGVFNDPYLNENANFYRIISPDELANLVITKKTGELIDSNGHFTNGHYSCITTNPNYNEQAFAANGLPIRLKFKTKNEDGLYNMNLLNRITGLKQERSIYKVCGYNFNDIDWDNVCVQIDGDWRFLGSDFIEKIAGID